MSQSDKWTIGSILKWTWQYFSDKGVASPRLDAEVLLCHVLNKDRLYLYVNHDKPLEGHELKSFRDMVKKRAMRLPVAYIVGFKEFMGYNFKVNEHVLIPRPDTEILVETTIEYLPQEEPKILDIGTGSGAIIISLLRQKQDAIGVAVDISTEALAIARLNAECLGVADRLKLTESDVFAKVEGQFDVIVSNPPYIPVADVKALEEEVKKEPLKALEGGLDGLDFYRSIIKDAHKYLKPKGFLIFEVGIHQAQLVKTLGLNENLEFETIRKDYGGIERVVVLRRKAHADEDLVS